MNNYAGNNNRVQRGGIYWVDIPYYTGAEIAKKRPAVVLSTDEHNENRRVATVVFCSSATQWENLPTHVDLDMEKCPNTKALCEHIYTVDVSRIDEMIRWASDDEMEAIGRETARYLGLNVTEIPVATVEQAILKRIEAQDKVIAEQRGEIRALKFLLEKLLNK